MRLTQAHRIEARRMRVEGESLRKIAERIGVSHMSVKRNLDAMGVRVDRYARDRAVEVCK